MLDVFEITDEATLAEATKRIINRGDAGEGDESLDAKLASTREIVDAVRERGDAAVAEFTAKFDGVELAPGQFEVTQAEIDAAMNEAEPELITALERAHANIVAFHSKNLRQSWREEGEDGAVLGQRVTPLESVGLYVPGGTAFYPSSVLMNIVPATVAGVNDIVMVSPPSYNGTIHPLVLAAAKIAGATRVFRVGGAHAVAALAYGTDTIPSVLKIAGPGNIFVTLAKRLVSEVCDIDKEAGPSEVVVVADDNANPEWAAIELMCQAEHGPDSPVCLITVSRAKAEEVIEAVKRLMPTLSRTDVIEKALEDWSCVYVARDLEEAAELANLYASEHMSIQVDDPWAFFDKVPNVGCAAVGGMTPVAVGDYYAGPNHILPTTRMARYTSPLTAEDFRKVTSIIAYTPERIAAQGDDIIRLARAEKLDAHARAVELRR